MPVYCKLEKQSKIPIDIDRFENAFRDLRVHYCVFHRLSLLPLLMVPMLYQLMYWENTRRTKTLIGTIAPLKTILLFQKFGNLVRKIINDKNLLM